MEIEHREDYGVIVFRGEGVVRLGDIISAMRSYTTTEGFNPSGGGVWDFQRATIELSFDEVGNFSRPIQSTGRYPRDESRVGILVRSETDRTILLECKKAAELQTKWAFFDDLDRALQWASG